jgi:hypothetical protein
MTPEEKAKELFYKMFKVKSTSGYPMCFDTAKQCALIAVNEILDSINWHNFDYPNDEVIFWNEVLTEIEKL